LRSWAIVALCCIVVAIAATGPDEKTVPFTIRGGEKTALRRPAPAFCTGATHRVPRRYVVMASDATAGYAFYLPLSVRVWQQVAGFESIVVLVGNEWREQVQSYMNVNTKKKQIKAVSVKDSVLM